MPVKLVSRRRLAVSFLAIARYGTVPCVSRQANEYTYESRGVTESQDTFSAEIPQFL
jgi:hypothetical protein